MTRARVLTDENVCPSCGLNYVDAERFSQLEGGRQVTIKQGENMYATVDDLRGEVNKIGEGSPSQGRDENDSGDDSSPRQTYGFNQGNFKLQVPTRGAKNKLDMPKFRGRECKVRHFFVKLRGYIKHYNIRGADALESLMLNALSGEGLDLYLSLALILRADIDYLEKSFLAHFEPVDHELVRKQEIMSLKKKDAESIAAYSLRLKTAADKLDLSDEMLEFSFVQGLSYEFKKHLLKKGAKGYEEMLEACRQHEKMMKLKPKLEAQKDNETGGQLDRLTETLINLEDKIGKLERRTEKRGNSRDRHNDFATFDERQDTGRRNNYSRNNRDNGSGNTDRAGQGHRVRFNNQGGGKNAGYQDNRGGGNGNKEFQRNFLANSRSSNYNREEMATRLRCYGCNEVGHIRENCPYGESAPRCSFCNKFGHTKVTCWHYLDKTRNDFGDGKGGAFANVVESNKRSNFLDYTCIEYRGSRFRCYECDEEGHFKKNCPHVKCWGCGRSGHISYNCVQYLDEIRADIEGGLESIAYANVVRGHSMRGRDLTRGMRKNATGSRPNRQRNILVDNLAMELRKNTEASRDYAGILDELQKEVRELRLALVDRYPGVVERASSEGRGFVRVGKDEVIPLQGEKQVSTEDIEAPSWEGDCGEEMVCAAIDLDREGDRGEDV